MAYDKDLYQLKTERRATIEWEFELVRKRLCHIS